MNALSRAHVEFPRFFNLGGYSISAYRFFLIVGLYVATIATAALADSVGRSPLRVGLAAMGSGLVGLVGARLYHMAIHARLFMRPESRRLLWDMRRGGAAVFGALLTFVPASYAAAWLLTASTVELWDLMSGGVLAGGFWIRLGCVFNGCCVGRETDGVLGVRLHDLGGACKPRLPVQYLEMAWWLLGGMLFLMLWPTPLPPGSYALGVLAWYGVGRCVLEPFRQHPELVFGRIRIDQLIAALLALGAGGTLLIRL